MTLTWILFTATKPSVAFTTAVAIAWNIVNLTNVIKDSAVKTALGVISPPIKWCTVNNRSSVIGIENEK